MNKFLSGLMATALAASFAIASVIPINAAPMPAPAAPSASQDAAQQVQYRRWPRNNNRINSDHMRYSMGERAFNRGWGGDNWRGNNWRGRDWRVDRRMDRRDWRADRRYDRRGYRKWRGYRGYPYYRSGYREYNGWWYPLGAFAAGAVIGSVINNGYYNNGYDNGAYSGGGSSHTQWCYNRYRSYRAYDNTFQPYNGPRRQCYSPYG